MGHAETVMPFCVTHYRVRDGHGRVIAERMNNHQSYQHLRFDPPVLTDRLSIEVGGVAGNAPAALFEVRAYCYDDSC